MSKRGLKNVGCRPHMLGARFRAGDRHTTPGGRKGGRTHKGSNDNITRAVGHRTAPGVQHSMGGLVSITEYV